MGLIQVIVSDLSDYSHSLDGFVPAVGSGKAGDQLLHGRPSYCLCNENQEANGSLEPLIGLV